jgi:hypothetical protein
VFWATIISPSSKPLPIMSIEELKKSELKFKDIEL